MKELKDNELSVTSGGSASKYREPIAIELAWIEKQIHSINEARYAMDTASPGNREAAKKIFDERKKELEDFIQRHDIDPKYAKYR